MQQHLRISINSLVEFLIRLGRRVDADVVADDETRVCAAGDDEVAEVAVVLFDVALACPYRETLFVSSCQISDQGLLYGRAGDRVVTKSEDAPSRTTSQNSSPTSPSRSSHPAPPGR